MMIEMQDVIELMREAGQAENDAKLRAIVAERRVRELEAELAALRAESTDGERSAAR